MSIKNGSAFGGKKLRIGHIASNLFQVPAPSTKNIFAPGMLQSAITESLVKKGHKVFMFAGSDAKTKAKLIHNNLPSLINLKNKLKPGDYKNRIRYYMLKNAQSAYQMAKEGKLDIIHSHDYRYGIFFADLVNIPTIITIHDAAARMQPYDIKRLNEFKNIYVVSISNNQREGLGKMRYIDTVYNGINTNKFKFNDKPKNYFLITGRIVKDKGIHLAVQTAVKNKINLKIAGEYYPGASEVYFKKYIKPYLNRKNIEYLGLVPYQKMPKLMANAKALLFPIQWPEPFGLVMAEAMAGGTPVIAYNKGSVSEIIKNKQTGFIVNNLRQMQNAIKNIESIDRKNCRRLVVDNFSLSVMVNNYEKVYYKVIQKFKKQNQHG